MLRAAAGVLAILLAACGAVGCGDAAHGSNAATVRRGGAIYRSSCGGCHTLSGHDGRAVGGDLVQAHLSAAAIASFALIMPVRRPLSHADALAVARYIRAVADR
jgi:mono/diheme cytochrome c family protein